MTVLEKIKNAYNKLVQKNILYSSEVCSDCQQAEKFFREQNIEIEIKKIEDPENREELRKKYGKVLVPTIILGGEKYIGFDLNKEEIKSKLNLGKNMQK